MKDQNNCRRGDGMRKDLPPLCYKNGRELTAPENWDDGIKEITSVTDAMETILSSDRNNNVILIGKAGTGKTTAVIALGRRIAERRSGALAGFRIVEINLDVLLKECRSVNERGTKVAHVIEEAKRNGIILFIDEGHRLCDNRGADSLGNIVKPLVTESKVKMILATTDEEYKQYIAADKALKRRFEPVFVNEPDIRGTVDILRSVARKNYPEFTLSDDILRALVSDATLLITDRNNPDKSLSVLAGAVAWQRNNMPGDLTLTEQAVRRTLGYRIGMDIESSFMSDANIFGMGGRLSKKYPGWGASFDKLEKLLLRARTRCMREKGPLCCAVLRGADEGLLEHAARSAAAEMGYTGENVKYLNVCNFNVTNREDAFCSAVFDNPYSAVIFSGFGSDRRDDMILSAMYKVSQIMREGWLKDANGRRADYSHAPVFLTVKSERAARNIGFGAASGAFSPSCPQASRFAEAADGLTVDFGAPDPASSEERIERFFMQSLIDGAEKLGLGRDFELTSGMLEKLRRIALGKTAWTDLHRAAEATACDMLAAKDRMRQSCAVSSVQSPEEALLAG